MSDRWLTTVDGEELTLVALGDRVVVERFEERPERIAGGTSLVLPQTISAKMRPYSGVVRAVPPRVSDLRPGDVVHWGVGCGVGVDADRVRIVRRSEIFAVERGALA